MVEARKEDLLPETHKPPVLSAAGPVWGGGGVGGSEGESTSPGSGCPRKRVRAGGCRGSG